MGMRPGQTLVQDLMSHREQVNANILSMCLAEWGGRLTVGGYNSSLHSGVLQYIPLTTSSGFYHVDLAGMKLGDSEVRDSLGRALVDSGTTFSYFAARPYQWLRKTIEDYCKDNRCKASLRGTCWVPEEADDLSSFPEIEMWFGSVATKWIPRAYLHHKGGHNWCYAFMNDGPGASVTLGASWMLHQDIIFDMPSNRLGIVPAKCPEFRNRPAHFLEGADQTFTSGNESTDKFTAEVRDFNLNLVWGGLAVGICTATGVIGIAVVFCRKTADADTEDRSRAVGNKKDLNQKVGASSKVKPEHSDEEDPLVNVESGKRSTAVAG